ncbi:chitin deacetylase 8-like [Plodia interpunctella]|uniref:chitin deacetylase 8-like n=1 Tax=Plodia interpunctella TaxID=58824 RepID=UPI002367EC9D|nr:chitin deacetylase 8-like [Plodia interpunctella]
MKGAVLLTLLLAAYTSGEDELQLADVCDPEACKLPDCRCSNTEIPGGLEARDTPQFVLLTFDDAVNIINVETYRNTIYSRRNKNSCPAGVTFYINHEYTDYQIVNELYNQGFEIALHSVTHQTNQTYWQEATYDDMAREFGDQIIQMSHFANIPSDAIKGVRIPFLQMTGNASFQVMADFNLEYDCTWPTVSHINPGLWPYTLDYASIQDCVVPPCPTASIPGPWVLPMVTWRDLNGTPCSMVDSCSAVPSTEEEWFQFILANFERHYMGNRAPFGFYIHEWYISDNVNPQVRRALVRFLDLINNLNDVFMVNSKEVIDWVKNPVPLDEYVQKPCATHIPTFCPPASCPVVSEHNQNTYWMSICNVCPQTYPWLGNPLGL